MYALYMYKYYTIQCVHSICTNIIQYNVCTLYVQIIALSYTRIENSSREKVAYSAGLRLDDMSQEVWLRHSTYATFNLTAYFQFSCELNNHIQT